MLIRSGAGAALQARLYCSSRAVLLAGCSDCWGNTFLPFRLTQNKLCLTPEARERTVIWELWGFFLSCHHSFHTTRVYKANLKRHVTCFSFQDAVIMGCQRPPAAVNEDQQHHLVATKSHTSHFTQCFSPQTHGFRKLLICTLSFLLLSYKNRNEENAPTLTGRSEVTETGEGNRLWRSKNTVLLSA